MTKQRLELTWYNKDQALIPTEQGKYGYTWVDPTDPRYCQTHFLEYGDTVRGEQQTKEEGRTYSERADFTPTDDNLLILGESGDVLETLTRVPELTDKYVGQVKCIYIDPPFNTAQTFANYEDNLEHSVWLTMMRDRLLHLKKLLSNDGSIWVHLDDVENHRMRLLMDEVFGAENFVAEIAWEKVDNPSSRLNRDIVSSHDTIHVYGKNASLFKSNNIAVGTVPSHFNMTDENGRHYVNRSLRKTGASSTREDRPLAWFPITAPDGRTVWPIKTNGVEGRWVWGKEKVDRDYDLLDWLPNRDGDLEPFVRYYFEGDKGVPPHSTWRYEQVGSNRISKLEIQDLFPGQNPFTTPKPERLLERIIHIATNPGDIVLDVFAGSGTTAAVAHKMGRRWVTCELVEDTFNRFTRPRLEKVVRGEDLGGITVTKGERVDASADGLPEGLTPEDAQKLTSLLNKAVRDEPELKKSADVKLIKQLVKTKKSPDTFNWRGGGGFTVARLSRDCFDVDEDTGLVVLTEDATARNLSAAVAAHLRFRMTPDNPVFPAKREKMNLFVTRQPLTQEFIDELVYYVPDGEAVTVAATSADSDLGRYLHKACPGSRIIHLPDGLFTRTLSHAKEA